MKLQIYSKTVKNPRKADSAEAGDSLVVSRLDDRGLILLAVADGVSGAPCDWC